MSQPRPSAPPPPKSSRFPERASIRPQDPRDAHFAQTLQEAELAQELTPAWLAQTKTPLADIEIRLRRYQLLSAYYREEKNQQRRAASDGFFAYEKSSTLGALDVIQELLVLCRELPNLSLQSLGSEDGPLVLRCGGNFAVIEDADDDQHQRDNTVAVRALFRAVNSLLAKAQSARRFVPMRSPADCEYYLAPHAQGTQRLWEAGLLQPMLLSELLDFCNWKQEDLAS